MNSAITSSACRSAAEAPLRPKLALVGNPNSGKTTLFNLLTGLKYKVGNYPGVTVERKEGRLRLTKDLECDLADLPGVYSLSGDSIDEHVAAAALRETPDALVVVVDACNLERNLFIVSELLDLRIPLVVALNMSDVAKERGIQIHSLLLSRLLDVPVVAISATKKTGIEELRRAIGQVIEQRRPSRMSGAWAANDEELLQLAEEAGRSEQLSGYGRVAVARYKWVHEIVEKSTSRSDTRGKRLSDRIDAIVMHKTWGIPIFIAVMALLFQSMFTWASIPMDFIDTLVGAAGSFVNETMPAGPLRSLIVDGIIAGVGSVIIFIPQIALLFLFIGLLEDSGYLCRAAFVMDRVMRPVGLQGRSFIPLLSSFACAVPGIMSTRNIPSQADRFTTILVAPLMSCSARLPVYAVLVSAFIPTLYFGGVFSLQGLVMLGLYALGIIGAACVAWLLKRTIFKGEPAPFLMEMPPFRTPNLSTVLRETLDRVLIFLKSAGTVIFACSIVLWFLASHPVVDGEPVGVEQSYAGQLGRALEPVIEPLGFDWKIGIGLIASFAAREVFVSALATVYNLENEGDAAASLTELLRSGAESGTGFGLPAALALLVFYVFACQCMSTLAVCRRETGSWKWPALMFGYMTVLAYCGAFVTYQLSSMVLG